ncbi:MAG: isoleucine--tRNA ligase [Candidatus Omnitrophica bacterium]|nr:isoleucine--tRNA ligase [Candidatus Omnitrophota bacterium]
MNYKDTLNLPQTKFSMKANLSVLEPKTIARWKDLDIYQRLKESKGDKGKFILHDGPPYANGLIHIGHALNKLLKDIIIKYKVLRGYGSSFIIGWDCHGLPVEHQLFKEMGLSKHDVEISIFRKKARDYALKFVKLQKQDFIRLGIFCDEKPYLTLDPEYEQAVINLLGDLTAQGYVYRGRKPINWCKTCETALAEAEVEYADKESDSIYFLFKLIEDKGIFSEKKINEVYFLVWTTTPWTVVSNVAVALHPKLEYCLVQFNQKKIILARDLIPSLEEKFKTKFKILELFKGADLEGLKLKHPFLDRASPLVLADFISHQEGSGCVHIAPGHGVEDFSLKHRYNLDIIMPVNDKGIFEEPAEFEGKNIQEANALVIRKLEGTDSLVNHSKINHSYPHCWRCKQPLIFRATFQWFLSVDHKDLRQKALKEIENVNWFPSSGKERMKGMLSTRPDWCLSRQRLWGIPIPAIKCKGCDKVILAKEIIDKTAVIFARNGSDSWFNLDIDKFLPDNFKCSCGGNKFLKEFDILDVWFESGASFSAVLKNNPELTFPADLYLEGSDQHRGWFQVSLIPSVAKENCAPFKTILTHGFVVDGEGRKMSKSLGNVIAPQEISKQYGAEILRLWAAYTDYSEDIKISEGIIKQLVDMYRKMRNTIKFILGNISDFNLTECDLTPEQLLEVDKFMLAKTLNFYQETISCYEEFSFYRVCQKVFNFCNLDLSSFYLDILKDRLYTFSQHSEVRQSAQFVLYHILNVLLKLIAPILSFTAEEAYLAWDGLKEKKDSIFLSSLDDSGLKKWRNDKLIGCWERILSLRNQVLKEIEKQREEGEVGSSLEASVLITCEDKDYSLYKEHESSLKEIFIVSSVFIEKGIFSIKVVKAIGKKCLRCWNWSEDIGEDSKYPDVCNKCLKNLLKEDSK